jgi:hypothetical protein
MTNELYIGNQVPERFIRKSVRPCSDSLSSREISKVAERAKLIEPRSKLTVLTTIVMKLFIFIVLQF